MLWEAQINLSPFGEKYIFPVMGVFSTAKEAHKYVQEYLETYYPGDWYIDTVLPSPEVIEKNTNSAKKVLQCSWLEDKRHYPIRYEYIKGKPTAYVAASIWYRG